MAADRDTAILVVDDFSTMVRIVRTLLHRLGFRNVDAAEGGEAALQRLRERPYGLVISGWTPGRMSGLDLLRRLRADAGLRDTPFIIAAPNSRTERLVAAAKAGADGHLVKPFNGRTLQNRIEAALAA